MFSITGRNGRFNGFLPFALTAMLFFLVFEYCSAWAQTAPEQELLHKKAAIIYNLCKFIHWPDSLETATKDAFIICVPTGSLLYEELHTFENRTVAGHPLQTIETGVGADEIKECRVLFLADTDSDALADRVDKLLTRTVQYPLLTISDIAGFSEQGGMIELIQAGERVRFAINVHAARQAGLVIAAPLLSIAATVDQGVSRRTKNP